MLSMCPHTGWYNLWSPVSSLITTTTIFIFIREVAVISNKIKKDEEEGGVAGEWKYAAMVMDRSDISYLMMMTMQVDKKLVFKAKNNGHQNLTLSKGISDPHPLI